MNIPFGTIAAVAVIALIVIKLLDEARIKKLRDQGREAVKIAAKLGTVDVEAVSVLKNDDADSCNVYIYENKRREPFGKNYMWFTSGHKDSEEVKRYTTGVLSFFPVEPNLAGPTQNHDFYAAEISEKEYFDKQLAYVRSDVQREENAEIAAKIPTYILKSEKYAPSICCYRMYRTINGKRGYCFVAMPFDTLDSVFGSYWLLFTDTDTVKPGAFLEDEVLARMEEIARLSGFSDRIEIECPDIDYEKFVKSRE